jgi:hypothetical protein
MRTFSLLMTIVLISLGVGPTPVAQGGFLIFTPIDFPGATETIALDINDVGEIVGRYNDAAGTIHGFLLSAGNFTSIDYPHPDVVFTVAAGINPRGDSVGQYQLQGQGANERHGFLSHGGTFTTIDFPDATFTNILGINPRGDMVGRYSLKDNLGNATPCALGDGNAHGFLRSMQGGFASIDFPDAVRTAAFGINTRGDIVGFYVDTGNNTHDFLLSQYERDGDEDER